MSRYNNRSDNKNKSELKNVMNEVAELDRLKDLKPKKYADKDGYADKIGELYSGKNPDLNTNQLRKFFGAIKKIQQKESWDEIEHDFYLLKPKFAVSVGRKVSGKPLMPKDFFDLMMVCMEKVDVGNNEEKLENFNTLVDFFESIVAYHKFYEKK
ncbi:MAG: type III-A CRISPR-associated protein Csm2 [Methanobrevibacter sp.]|jgi:CRISPR-associated protein Csm2|nr:type III-A CRISPR-associated protein Csm2 [Candidatus Methanovirga australis]